MSRPKQEPARQHGAMEFTESPTDLDAVRRYRLGRVREQLARADCAGILLYDALNLRYATDVTNMPVWSMHNENRYAFIATNGPVILFESYIGAVGGRQGVKLERQVLVTDSGPSLLSDFPLDLQPVR